MRTQDSEQCVSVDIMCGSPYVCMNDQKQKQIGVFTMQRAFAPEQRNFLLLICPIRLLASRRGLVQRAPLVSMGLSCR